MRKNNGTIATFEYDALGRRIETVDAIAGTTTRYYYDDQRAVVQTRVSGSVEFWSVGLAHAGLFETVFDSVGTAHPTD